MIFEETPVASKAAKSGRPPKYTEAEAFAVMDRLANHGEPISVAIVTKELGGGSSTTTIAAYVRRWRRLQDLKAASGGRLGAALARTVQAFWDELEATLSKEQAKLLAELEAQLAARDADLRSIRTTVRELQDRNIALETENRVLREQLERRQP